MKKFFWFGSCLFFILLIYLVFFRCTHIRCISITQFQPLLHEEVYESNLKAFRALYTTNQGFLRVERHAFFSSQKADTLTKATTMTIQGLYADARSPYPGPLSDEIVCDKKYKTQTETYQLPSGEMTTLISFANNRLQYGSCMESQIIYKGYISILYCPLQATWYKVELLIPIQGITDDTHYLQQLHAIRCH